MIRRQLTEFELGPVLGVGTVGTIYQATEKSAGKRVAIKILLPAVMTDPIVVARFEREMFILAKLSHPNIVAYFGGGRTEGQLFYVMELVEGASLKEVLADCGRLSWQETVTIARQVCSALQHAHNHGIIHRDLKPANLFLTRSGQVKLGDFGIARDLNMADITSTGLTVGTNAYMSPEQITGDRAISGQTDLYSLGCVMFEMLTGRPPFEGANFAQLFQAHIGKPPPAIRTFAADCPAALEALVHKLLAKNPDERPFNARAVQGLLIQMLEGEPATAGVTTQLIDRAAGALADEPAPGGDREAAAVVPPDDPIARLARRIERMEAHAASREVSWWSLLGIGVATAVVIWLAWMCSG